MASSTSGSSKRARGGNNGGHPVSCLVDGCNSDLSNCRDYHRRHKVCELHSKTPEVTIGGFKQRFCQQCSRFHSLEEFDEGKRSCRKRLDGHNRRRRKPQTDLLPRPGSFFSYNQGSQLLPFSSSQVLASTNIGSHGWSSSAADPTILHNRNQQLNLLEKQSLFVNHGIGNSNYKTGQQLAFLQGESSRSCHGHGDLSSQSQPLLHTINTDLSENGGGGGGGGGGERNKMVYDRFRIGVRDSDCALSLLSSSQTHAENSGQHHGHMGSSRIEQRNVISLMQPLNHNSYESIDSSAGISNDSHHHHHHHHHHEIVNFPGMFEVGSDNGGNESPSTLPFHWE